MFPRVFRWLDFTRVVASLKTVWPGSEVSVGNGGAIESEMAVRVQQLHGL